MCIYSYVYQQIFHSPAKNICIYVCICVGTHVNALIKKYSAPIIARKYTTRLVWNLNFKRKTLPFHLLTCTPIHLTYSHTHVHTCTCTYFYIVLGSLL